RTRYQSLAGGCARGARARRESAGSRPPGVGAVGDTPLSAGIERNLATGGKRAAAAADSPGRRRTPQAVLPKGGTRRYAIEVLHVPPRVAPIRTRQIQPDRLRPGDDIRRA